MKGEEERKKERKGVSMLTESDWLSFSAYIERRKCFLSAEFGD
jgi:hypothetical protein